MAEPVVLEGEHVRLEPLALDHVDGLVAAATEDRATYGFTFVPADGAGMRAAVGQLLADQRAGLVLPFATCDRAGGRVVGATRFLDMQHWPPVAGQAPKPVFDAALVPHVVEIGGTWLAASAQRTAVNTEAKLLMLGHAFEVWRVHRVMLKTDARNERSRAAIQRLGAGFDGVRRADMPAADGGIRDSAYFSIVRAEWPDVRAGLHARLAAPTPAR